MNLSILTFKGAVSAKSWFMLLFVLLFTLLGAINIFNYSIDPFEYHSKHDAKHSLDKTRAKWYGNFIVVKLNQVKNGSYSNFIVGSSRVGHMELESLKKYYKGDSYNFYVPQEQPHDALAYIHYIAKHAKRPIHILYGIEFAGFNRNTNSKLYLKKRLRNFIELDALGVYMWLQNFSIHTLEASIQTEFFPKKSDLLASVKIFDDGRMLFQRRQKAFDAGKYNFKKVNSLYLTNFMHHGAYYLNYELSKKELEAFEEIIAFCKREQIDIKVFLTPIHQTLYHLIDRVGLREEFENFKYKISTITEFVDFTPLSSITQNDDYFWDAAHYKKELTPFIYEKLLLNRGNFGRFIKKDRVQLR